MNIACVIDNKFVPYCGIMLTSLFENNRNKKLDIYILSSDLNKSAQKELLNIASLYGMMITFCFFNKTMLKDCILTKNTYITLATYYKLLMAEVLPETIDKVLYLDCDIIVRRSISELYTLEIENYPLAAVDETLYGDHTSDISRLSYNPVYKYFNAGVLLINLKYWRKYYLTNRFLEYVKNYPERIKYHEQDVLNAVLHDKWLALDYKWNVMSFAYQRDFYATHANMSFIVDPSIIHYTCTPKPWHIGCFHPLKSEFIKYKKMTSWRKKVYPFQGLSVTQAIRCIWFAITKKVNYTEL